MARCAPSWARNCHSPRRPARIKRSLNREPAARLCSSADKRRSQDAPRRGGTTRSARLSWRMCSEALADDSSLPYLLCTVHAVRQGRQLQHRCVLAFIEPSDQHDLSVREFERIVMHVRFVCVDLPKTGYLGANCLFTLPAYENGKPALELDLLFERNLCAGKQAHRHVWFSHSGKTARDRVIELRRYEFVPNLCGSGRYMMQTVVAHRQHSLIGTARSLSFAKKYAAGGLVSTERRAVILDGQKTLREHLFCDWRRLLFTQLGKGHFHPPASQTSK